MVREKPGAPALGVTTINGRQRWIWVNTCRSGVFKPEYMVWTFHGESGGRRREEVVRQRTDEYGTGIEDMVQDFDDARDEDDDMEESVKAFCEMLESSKRPLHAHTELCQLDAITQ